MIHATEKSLQELGEQVSAEEKSAIETAINALKEAVKGDDKDAIEAKTSALTELSGKLAEKVYAQKSAEGEADNTGQANTESKAESPADDVVDAEFEEVKDDEKK